MALISSANLLDFAGVLFGIAFFGMSIRGARSLQGSFFKNYYWFMMAGALALTFGFLIEPAGSRTGIPEKTIELLHDLSLLVESALFVYASYVLPNDVRKYLVSKEEGKL